MIRPLHYLIAITGQSNSIGVGGYPLICNQNWTNSYFDSPALSPFLEPIVPSAQGESIAGSITRHIWHNTDPFCRMILSSNGISGTPYSGLKKGTAAFNGFLTQLNALKSWCTQYKFEFKTPCVFVVHGESDSIAANIPTYSQNCIDWRIDYQNAIQAAQGDSNTVPMVLAQMGNHKGMNDLDPNYSANIEIAMIQLELARSRPSEFVLVPTYILPRIYDNIHATNEGHATLGEYMGKVLHRILNGQSPNLLMPMSANRVGNVISITFSGGVMPLVFETESLWDLFSGKGFSCTDSNGNLPIQSVQIVGRVIKVTLQNSPTGTATISYGKNRGDLAGVVIPPGGCIRDSDTYPSIYYQRKPLYNFAPIFQFVLN
jgi:hypothetical protein